MRISVITVVYNAAAVLEATLQSVREQERTGFELEHVVIDGGSTDGTLALLDRYREHIDILRSEPDHGIYDAMNKAVRLATGDFLLFLNAGDTFVDRSSLAVLAALATAPGEQVIFAGWVVDYRNGQLRTQAPNLARGWSNHQSTLYSRSIHSWHGPYPSVPGFVAADFFFFRTLQMTGRVAYATTAQPVSQSDPFGVSSGLPTYMQRVVVDLLCGSQNRYVGALKIIIHPTYHRIKRLFIKR